MIVYKNEIKNEKDNKYNKYNKYIFSNISDCHIRKNNNDFADKFIKNFSYDLYKIDNESTNSLKVTINKRIDLIVISGDIINSGKSSKEMLDNYFMAYEQV